MLRSRNKLTENRHKSSGKTSASFMRYIFFSYLNSLVILISYIILFNYIYPCTFYCISIQFCEKDRKSKIQHLLICFLLLTEFFASSIAARRSSSGMLLAKCICSISIICVSFFGENFSKNSGISF